MKMHSKVYYLKINKIDSVHKDREQWKRWFCAYRILLLRVLIQKIAGSFQPSIEGTKGQLQTKCWDVFEIYSRLLYFLMQGLQKYKYSLILKWILVFSKNIGTFLLFVRWIYLIVILNAFGIIKPGKQWVPVKLVDNSFRISIVVTNQK